MSILSDIVCYLCVGHCIVFPLSDIARASGLKLRDICTRVGWVIGILLPGKIHHVNIQTPDRYLVPLLLGQYTDIYSSKLSFEQYQYKNVF